MDTEGIKFLDKLYQNLYMSDVVQHTKDNKDNRTDAIRKYLERLERVHKMADTESKKRHLLNLYFDKYVIKAENIPYGVDKEAIISAQKKTLSMWIDYLSDPTTTYPMWAKYWAFQGMLKMGSYDESKEEYLRRDKKTTAPFVEPNPEIIAKSIEVITKLVKGEEIDDIIEERLSKTDSFKKIYTTFEKKFKKNIVDKTDSKDGIWIKYNQGSKKDAIKLTKSLENKNTGWCTASSEEMAKKQICGPYSNAQNGGDFYVYYTKDKDGKYTIPRIAIRLKNHDEIGEIRGILDGQNMEESMTPALETKLRSMDFLTPRTVKENLEKVDGLKELTRIGIKTERNEPLSEEEIMNLYTKVYGFGWTQDPRVEKIQAKRNKKEDIEFVKDPVLKFKNMGLFYTQKSVDDKNFMLSAIKVNYQNMIYASEKLVEDKDFIIKAVKINHKVLDYIDKEYFKNNPDVCLDLMKKNSDFIVLISKDILLQNSDLVIKCLKDNPPNREAIKTIPEEIIEKCPSILKVCKRPLDLTQRLSYVSEDFQLKHPYIIMDILLKSPTNMQYISDAFQIQYPEIISLVIAKHPDILYDGYIKIINKETIIDKAETYRKKLTRDLEELLHIIMLLMPEKISDPVDYVFRQELLFQQKNSVKREIRFRKLKSKLFGAVQKKL